MRTKKPFKKRTTWGPLGCMNILQYAVSNRGAPNGSTKLRMSGKGSGFRAFRV